MFKNLWTLGRGKVHETVEAIEDSQALTILDQQIRDAKSEQNKAKDSLAQMRGNLKLAESELKDVQADITKYETYAVSALEKGDEKLATTAAEKVAELEELAKLKQETVKTYTGHTTKLGKIVEDTERRIRKLESEVNAVKAMEQVQDAASAMATSFPGNNSGLSDAATSLERIKKRQAQKAAHLEANSVTVEESFDAQFEKLNADTGAASVLERLKAKADKKSKK